MLRNILGKIRNFSPQRIFHEYDKQYRIKKYPNFPVLKIMLGTAVVGTTGIFAYTVFRKPIRKMLTSEGSHVTAEVIKSDQVKESIRNGVTNLIDNEELTVKLKENIKIRLVEIANEKWFSDIIKELGLSLARELCNNDSLREELSEMFISLFKRDDIKSELAEMFKEVVRRQDIKNEMNVLIKQICTDKQNKDEVAIAVKEILARDDIKKELGKTARSSVYNAIFKW
jgi:hypothetical protein